MHLVEGELSPTETNPVDSKNIQAFWCDLYSDEWHLLKDRLEANRTDFSITPTTRVAGEVREQATMFFCDPSDNTLRFKTLLGKSMIFVQ